jgi:hypothetical protein
MRLLYLVAQATDTGTASTGTPIVRIVAGVLALVCVIAVVIRRKKKASKEDWS